MIVLNLSIYLNTIHLHININILVLLNMFFIAFLFFITISLQLIEAQNFIFDVSKQAFFIFAVFLKKAQYSFHVLFTLCVFSRLI